MEQVEITNGKKTFKCDPAHAQVLLTKGYSLTKCQKMPSNKAISASVNRKPAVIDLTRAQLEALEVSNLQEIYTKLKGVQPTVDHTKARLIEDILVAQDVLKEEKKEDEEE